MDTTEKYPVGRAVVRLLKFHHILPENDDIPLDYEQLAIVCLYQSVFCFLIVSSTIFHVSAVYWGVINGDICEDLVIIANFAFIIIVFLSSYFKLRDVMRLMKDLGNFGEFGEPENMPQLIRRQNLHTYALHISISLAVVSYCIILILVEPWCIENNQKSGKDYTCGLAIPAWLPFNLLENMYARRLLMILQMVAVLNTFPVTATGSYSCIVIASHLVQRIKHLKSYIRATSQLESYESIKAHLRFCARYHQSIISMTYRMDDCFRNGNRVHMILTSVIVGLVEYTIMKKHHYEGIIFLAAWLLLIVLLGAAGQKLIDEVLFFIDQSTSVTLELYSMKWYNMDPKVGAYIRIMMVRSQRPLQMTAGIFFSHSFELIQMICETSYRYMTLLSQFTD